MSDVKGDDYDDDTLTADIAQYFTRRELDTYGVVVLGLLPKRVIK
jgi:hypothetical protein